jgi:hypothetical protein
VEEIVDGVWRWTARHPEWQPDVEWAREVASFAFAVDETLVLVDPLVPDEVWPRLDELAEERAGVAAMITIPYHVRSSEAVLARYGSKASVWGHQAAARRMRDGSALRPVEPGVALPAGAEAFAIGSPRRQEQPLWFPSLRARVRRHGRRRRGNAARVGVGRGRHAEAAGVVPGPFRPDPRAAARPRRRARARHPRFADRGRRPSALRQGLAADPWHYR